MLQIRCSFLGKTVAYKRGQKALAGVHGLGLYGSAHVCICPFPAAQQPSITQWCLQSRMIFPLKSGHIKPSLKLMLSQLSFSPHFQAMVPNRTLQDASPSYPAPAFCPHSHGPDALKNRRTRETTSNRTRGNGFQLKDSRFGY